MAQPGRATVIATLADVYCFQANAEPGSTADGSTSGTTQPATVRRRTFPRALKRLRDRLRILEERLVLDANALRQDVKDLELRKTLLQNKLLGHEARVRQRAVAVVSEYFSVFEFGWLPRRGRDSAVSLHALMADRQRHFLRTAVAPEAARALAAQWQTLSRNHGSLRLVLTSVESVGAVEEPIVIAIGTLAGDITPEAVSHVHPREAQDRQLLARLSRERIEYPCRVTCTITSSGMMIGHSLELETVMALRCLVGSLARVDRVLCVVEGVHPRLFQQHSL